MITVELNGRAHRVAAGTSVADLITAFAGSTRGSAVVLDDEVVPRGEWTARLVEPGQRVELITAVQGG